MEQSALSGMTLSHPSPQGPGVYAEEGAGRLLETEVMEDSKE